MKDKENQRKEDNEPEKLFKTYSCMNCQHPICPNKGKEERYCGNYVEHIINAKATETLNTAFQTSEQ